LISAALVGSLLLLSSLAVVPSAFRSGFVKWQASRQHCVFLPFGCKLRLPVSCGDRRTAGNASKAAQGRVRAWRAKFGASPLTESIVELPRLNVGPFILDERDEGTFSNT
jgi:hypothetical protein